MIQDKSAVIISSDHAGFEMKEFVKKQLEKNKIHFKDVGVFQADKPADFPEYISKAASAVSAGVFKRGIAICGAGIGASIVANRFPKVRAALCVNVAMAQISRAHNDSNMLVLGGRFTTKEDVVEILQTWLSTAFEGGRHARRIKQIDDSARLAIALGHINQIKASEMKPHEVNAPFLKRAARELDKIRKHFLPDERRAKRDSRLPESCPSVLNYETRKYDAIMLDLSEHGAQFKVKRSENSFRFINGDQVVMSIKTPYGASSCKGIIRWADKKSSTIGVVFTEFPKNPKDPLPLLLDSMM
jgi:ribose 5-phosphate isomerase B